MKWLFSQKGKCWDKARNFFSLLSIQTSHLEGFIFPLKIFFVFDYYKSLFNKKVNMKMYMTQFLLHCKTGPLERGCEFLC
jgi:hypothetical protein